MYQDIVGELGANHRVNWTSGGADLMREWQAIELENSCIHVTFGGRPCAGGRDMYAPERKIQ